MEEKTYFAPALRSTPEEILKEHEIVASQRFFNEIFGSIPGIGAVIDKNRQILYANDNCLVLLGLETLEPILGKRPGEIVSCIHSEEESSGCGTSAACEYCGSVNAILESQKTGLKSTKETRISTVVGGKLKSWEMNISSTPITIAGQEFYVLMIQDISNEKRRFALERIFFHDLLNSAGGLNGLLKILKKGTGPEETRELITMSEEASRNIIEEIMLYKQISEAESGELQVKVEMVNSKRLLDSVIGKISSHEVGQNIKVAVSDNSADIDFETDRLLIQRVMINLLKNAFEATDDNGSVKAGVESHDGKIRFWVKNDGVLPTDVQMQLFQRSFSTKGQNRGLGTYSIRLLTENYLNGKVSFISNEKEGTIFSVELDKIWPSFPTIDGGN